MRADVYDVAGAFPTPILGHGAIPPVRNARYAECKVERGVAAYGAPRPYQRPRIERSHHGSWKRKGP